MTLLQLMLDGGLAAAELLALLFAAPAAAREPAALEQPVRLHRLSSSVDARLLGSLADVRVAQALRNASSTTADLAPRLPIVDERVDGLRVAREARVIGLLPGNGCGASPVAGHARLTDDEAIADAVSLAPGSEAVIETVSAQPLTRYGQTCRLMLPAQVDAEVPRATLIDADDGPFLLLVPHRAAHRGTLVLRPAAGHAESLDLGALDPRQAVLVPLASRAQLDGLAQGAVELELADGHATWWTTLVAHRAGARAALQTRGAE